MYAHWNTLKWILNGSSERPESQGSSSLKAGMASFSTESHALSPPPPAERSRSLRRGAMVAGSLLAHGTLSSLVNVGRGLDHVLAPGFRRTPLNQPLYVVATPRSGTTFLHHLLALDEEQFSHLRLYQTVFPSVVWQRGISLLRQIDSRVGHPLTRLMDVFNRSIFRSWEGVHNVALDAEEEDEALFVFSLVSPALYLVSPYVHRFPQLQDLDSLPAPVIEQLAKDYRATLQRHLYLWGNGKGGQARRLLVKTVLSPSRLNILERAVPDARFVRIVRDPVRAIPSAMNLFFSAWRAHSPDIQPNSEEARALGEMFIHHYRKLDEFAQQQDQSRVLTLRFEEMVKAPVQAVEAVYDHFGLDLTDAYRARLDKAVASPEQFRSSHDYSAEEFGLTADGIRASLAEILPRLGY